MLSKIHDDEEKREYIKRMKEIDELICSQPYLPRNSRIDKSVIKKLKTLYDGLENEIILFDKINNE